MAPIDLNRIQEIQEKFNIVGRNKELEYLLLARLARKHVLIEGPVGVGKTTLALAVSKYFDQAFLRIDGDERYSESKLVGYFEPPVVVKKGWAWDAFVSGPLVSAMQDGSVFMINEVNRLVESTQNVFLPALDEGVIYVPKIGEVKAKEGFMVIATQNPESYIGTSVLSEALKDRFSWLKLDYQSYEEEKRIVMSRSALKNKDPRISDIVVRIVRETRRHPDISRGSSIRGAIDLAEILALRPSLVPDEIIEFAILTLGTKIDLEEGSDRSIESIITEIIQRILADEESLYDGELEDDEESIEKRKVRLFGRIGAEDLAEEAIQSGNVLPKLDNLDYAAVERLTESAIDHENLPALVSLAKINSYAVSNTLDAKKITSLGRIAGKGGVITPRLYFVMRGVLDKQRRVIFRRLARSSLLRMSLRIAGQGLRGDIPKRGPYAPGMDFDLEETLEQNLEQYPTGNPYLSFSDIVGIEKHERQKNGILILDASGSMMGERNINAALTASVMAYSMRKDKYAVIAFNTKAFIIKKVKEDMPVQDIVDRILDLEAVGFTNVEDALRKAANEMRTIKSQFKWAILLTDGAYNKGKDPRHFAREIGGRLHVINLPGKNWGQKVCQDLARIGGGKYVAVRYYRDVPRALMRILRSPW
ncbi:MAG: AAA family ATPase [Promethearchaeota archaeon]